MSGDLSALKAEDKVDYLCVSAFPNDYTPTGSSLIQALDKAGISVSELAKNKLADYRTEYPCWISRDIAGAAIKRLAVFEPANTKSAYDNVSFLFSAVRAAQDNDSSPICAALPLLSTGYVGADETEMLEAIFYAAAHWCGMAFPFSEIKIVLYRTKTSENSLLAHFTDLCRTYADLEHLELPDGYSHYVQKAAAVIGKKTLPPCLTYRQAFAICVYTSGFSATINGKLRENNQFDAVYKKMLPLLEAIDTGLMNLACFSGTTYRGEEAMSKERIAENVKGNIVTNLAYTSSSYSPAGSIYLCYRYHFYFSCIYGVTIEDYSMYPGEKEVLFSKKMQYLVKDVEHTNYYVFTADEQKQNLRR